MKLPKHILLMDIINRHGPYSIMLDYGYTYSQIYMILESMIKYGYVAYDDEDEAYVTESGKTLIDNYKTRRHLNNKELWIHAQKKYYKRKLDSGTIIVPDLKK